MPVVHEAAYIIRYLGSRRNSQSKRFSVPLVGFLDDRLRAYRCSKAPEVVLRMERRQKGAGEVRRAIEGGQGMGPNGAWANLPVNLPGRKPGRVQLLQTMLCLLALWLHRDRFLVVGGSKGIIAHCVVDVTKTPVRASNFRE